MWFVLAWGLPRCGRKNSVICLLILPLSTNALSKNNYPHVVELPFGVSKIILEASWHIFRGAP